MTDFVMIYPDSIRDVQQLEDLLSEPTSYLIDTFHDVTGDIIILGVAGKMGPTLARMAQRAVIAAGGSQQIIGVARFSNPSEKQKLQSWGIETIRSDLLDGKQLNALPDAPNVIHMAGMKFGATGNEGFTWAMNCLLPAMVCQRYRNSRIVAFSTGNVYGLSPVGRGGSKESDELNPVGEYAMSCLGRERVLEHFSRSLAIPVSIIRLYYATEMRYGVLVDIAQKIWRGEAIDVSMGHLNALWQRDANAQALACLPRASSPPFVINVVGPEALNVRSVAQQFGRMLGKSPGIIGIEAADALLGDSSLSRSLFGDPSVDTDRMMVWIADWVGRGGESLHKPTHFEERSGKF
jgi:nucleoside-diphosphate-sugar epimerase